MNATGFVRSRRYCANCEAETIHGMDTPAPKWAIVLMLATLGLFFVPYLLYVVLIPGAWQCSHCGRTWRKGDGPSGTDL